MKFQLVLVCVQLIFWHSYPFVAGRLFSILSILEKKKEKEKALGTRMHTVTLMLFGYYAISVLPQEVFFFCSDYMVMYICGCTCTYGCIL